MDALKSFIRVAVADDHPVFREGFQYMLKRQNELLIEVVGEAANGRELLELVINMQPHVVITDVKMPVMNGVEATKKITASYPDVGVIALSMFEEEGLVRDMLEAGARGYQAKNADTSELLHAIRAVRYGGNYFSNTTSKALLHLCNEQQDRKTTRFSEQELRIIRLICQQLTSKEIAFTLELSPRTVDDYRQRIQEKIGAKCAVGIAIYAIKNGLVEINKL